MYLSNGPFIFGSYLFLDDLKSSLLNLTPGFPEDAIKRVEEALATKYKRVDDAMDEVRKLSLGSYKLKEGPNKDPKRIVNEGELERYLAEGWDVQTVLPSGRILIKKVSSNDLS